MFSVKLHVNSTIWMRHSVKFAKFIKFYKNSKLWKNTISLMIFYHHGGGTLNHDKCNIPLNSALHCSQWGYFCVASGHTISFEKSNNITFILGLDIKMTRYLDRCIFSQIPVQVNFKGNSRNLLFSVTMSIFRQDRFWQLIINWFKLLINKFWLNWSSFYHWKFLWLQ